MYFAEAFAVGDILATLYGLTSDQYDFFRDALKSALNIPGPPSFERKKPCLDKDLAEPPKKIKSDCDNLVQAEMKAQKVSD